jgi:hypothetical protein
VAAGDATQEGGDAAEEGAKDLGEELGISREAKPEPAGKGEGPLPIGSAGQNSVAKMRRGVGHAPALATRADPTLLAAERHQHLVAAAVGPAANPREAAREHAAAEVAPKASLDEARHPEAVLAPLAGVGEEALEVLADHAVERRGPRLAWAVARRQRAAGSARESLERLRNRRGDPPGLSNERASARSRHPASLAFRHG